MTRYCRLEGPWQERVDVWTDDAVAHMNLGFRWIGETTFEIDRDAASDPGDCPSPVRPPPVCIWDIKATVPNADTIKVAGVTRRKLIKWLIDTGCGHDLLSESMRRQLRAALCSIAPLKFETAGGLVTTGNGANVWIPDLDEWAQPYVLHTNTPAVLSIGARCMEHGYSFIWLRGEAPYFIKPDGNIVEFDVIDNIPYLIPGKASCQPKTPSKDTVLPSVPGIPVATEDVEEKVTAAGEQDERAVQVEVEPLPHESRAEAQGDRAEPHGLVEEEDEAGPGVPEAKDVSRLEKTYMEQAESVDHCLVHKPKLPFCRVCSHAKMKDVPHGRGAFK
ncbi:MAG: hypothetical protein GY768_27980, partial [Planctomycetaceae bacterium]|nr:hypothetical protein [Planctomycetaceae bacterium]